MPPTTTILDPTSPQSPLHYPSPQTALLLCDFHTFITAICGPSAPPAVAAAARLRAWALSNHILLLHCLVDTAAPAPPHHRMADTLGPRIAPYIASPADLAIAPGINAGPESPDERRSSRSPYVGSALRGPGVRALLAERGVKSLVVAGIATQGVVLSTALEGADEGFVVTVVRDACAHVTKAGDAVMEDVLAARVGVCGVEELVEAWGKA